MVNQLLPICFSESLSTSGWLRQLKRFRRTKKHRRRRAFPDRSDEEVVRGRNTRCDGEAAENESETPAHQFDGALVEHAYKIERPTSPLDFGAKVIFAFIRMRQLLRAYGQSTSATDAAFRQFLFQFEARGSTPRSSQQTQYSRTSVLRAFR